MATTTGAMGDRAPPCVVVAIAFAATATTASAQTLATPAAPSISRAFAPSTFVVGGNRTEAAGLVRAAVVPDMRHVMAADATRAGDRRSDSLLNGALIGAGAAVATGLFLCTRSEPWRNCRDDAGPMVKIGAIGAGIGIAIDALIRRRDPANAGTGASRLVVAPLVGRGAAGVAVQLTMR